MSFCRRQRGAGFWIGGGLLLLLGCAAMETDEHESSPIPNPGLPGSPQYGMEITGIQVEENAITLTTTGAVYTLKPQSLEMTRRIDPRTNAENPLAVARLDFAAKVSPFTVESIDRSECIIQAKDILFTFKSDSLFLIENQSTSTLTYNHTHLIPQVPWDKSERDARMWTDGYGGSLLAAGQGEVTTVQGVDAVEVQLSAHASMGHMVFPAKPFDFESLYGETARPFVEFLYSYNQLDTTLTRLSTLEEKGFGVFVIFAGVYDYPETSRGEAPVVLENGVLGYRYKYPDQIRDFISQAHQRGFKVITYMQAGLFNVQRTGQSLETTYAFMKELQSTFHLDGWYFDNADIAAGNMLENYRFMRTVRKDVGDDGILYHHNSVDAVGRWSGFRAIMIDSYVNYILAGETHYGPPRPDSATAIASPDNPYFRYFSAGYGLSQAYAAHKLASTGETPILDREKNRVMGQNLNGVERNAGSPPIGYRERKEEYLSGQFVPDVKWPPTDWFRTPEQVHTQLQGNQISFEWNTQEAADQEIVLTKDGIWFPTNTQNSALPRIQDFLRTHDHLIRFQDLEPRTTYQYRIRSSNQASGLGEVIWGQVGSFTTE